MAATRRLTAMDLTAPYYSPVYALLVDGTTVEIRSARPSDLAEVRRLHAEMSDASFHRRFAGGSRTYGEASALRICAPPRPGFAALVVVLDEQVIGVAEWTSAEGPGIAEVAFAVDEAHHHRGVGTLLLEHLVVVARRHGVRYFVAYVMADNHEMHRVFSDAGLTVESSFDAGLMRLVVSLTEDERYLDAVAERERHADVESLRPLFEPRSVVVVGAGRRRGSVGRAILDNITSYGFTGGRYVVNTSVEPGEEIGGVPACRSVADLPEIPDLAVIAVPAPGVAEAAELCGQWGVRGVVVVTSGLDGTTGKALLRVVRRHGMRLIGPNCFGIAATGATTMLDATFARRHPKPGRAGLIVQSGGVGIALLEHLSRLGVGVSTFASVGDKYDVSGNDMLQWWESDDQTELAVLYLESFGNPRKFGRIARRVAKRMPVLTVAAGRSEAGKRAAASHTAAAATPAAWRDALYAQAGVIAARSLEELTGTAALLAHQHLPAGPSVAVISNAGGAGVLAADACADVGLVVASLPDDVQAKLQATLPAMAAVTNPIDTTAAVDPSTLRRAIEDVAALDTIDALLILVVPTALGDLTSALESGVDAHGKPMVAVVLDQPETVVALPSGPTMLPSFADADAATRALAHATRYARWRALPTEPARSLAEVRTEEGQRVADDFLRDHPDGGWLDPGRCAALLDCYGLPRPEQELATSPEAAAATAVRFGRPVALKAYWPELVHKTDVGAIRLDVEGEHAVREAYADMAQRFGSQLAGVLVQPMAQPGVEILAGIAQDEVFGPLIVFGLGGVAVEVLKETRARLAPLTDRDVKDLVRGGRLAPLLLAHRGREGVDLDALEDLVARLARLAEDLPQVVEADLNPVIGRPDGVTVVDARFRLAPREAPEPFLRRLR